MERSATEKVIAIHQPNFLPWLGYFNKIYNSDVFVFLDDVKFVKGSVCNRNRISRPTGEAIWLGVPVQRSSDFDTFTEVKALNDAKWLRKTRDLLHNSYSRSPFYKELSPAIMSMLEFNATNIADYNIQIIMQLCHLIELTPQTKTRRSSELTEDLGTSNHRNLNLVRLFNGTVYLSGTGAKKYNDEDLFSSNNVQLRYQNFRTREYSQAQESFIENLSIVDALFNVGISKTRELVIAKSR